LLDSFTHDLAVQVDLLGLDDGLVDAGVQLISRYRLRGCDSLHLAAALRLYAEFNRDLSDDEPAINVVFVCADDHLNAAAVAEGLAVANPNHQWPEIAWHSRVVKASADRRLKPLCDCPGDLMRAVRELMQPDAERIS
jgi:hypothetical protein